MPKTTTKFDFVDNTFTAKEQEFAVCEVGDAKQPDAFYPQVKLMRWKNEVNFSLRLVHDEAEPVVSVVEDRIQWAGKAVEAHFYEVGEGKAGGGFEFDITLKEKPPTNRITFTLQTKGLIFLPQPQLKNVNPDGSFWEEDDHGGRRECPANIGDSIAVYHQTMAGNYTALGGNNYKTGKFCHIPRPKMIDAQGWEVWGKPTVDEAKDLFHVDMPLEFWAKAVYPVRHAAGLEFGYHTVGGSWYQPGGSWSPCTTRWQMSGNGTLQKVSSYLKSAEWWREYRNGCYLNSSGPAALLAGDTAGQYVDSLTGVWRESVALSGSLTNGSYYWLATAILGAAPYIAYDNTGTSGRPSGGGDGTLINPFPNFVSLDVVFSIFADYAAVATSAPVFDHHYRPMRA
jgi:hypothetical protein